MTGRRRSPASAVFRCSRSRCGGSTRASGSTAIVRRRAARAGRSRRSSLAEELGASKVAACVTGGETRSASVRAGLAEVPDDAAVVLVHDAARPLLPPEIVPRLLEALGEGFDGAVPGLPVADTVKRVRDGVVVETPARDELVAVQTPQAFVASVLRAALPAARAPTAPRSSRRPAAGSRSSPGDERLLKVTTPRRPRAGGGVAVGRSRLRRRRDARRRDRHVGARGGRGRRPALHADGRVSAATIARGRASRRRLGVPRHRAARRRPGRWTTSIRTRSRASRRLRASGYRVGAVGQHAGVRRGRSARPRRRRRLVRDAGASQKPVARVLRRGSSSWRASSPPRSPTWATAWTTTSARRSPPACSPCTFAAARGAISRSRRPARSGSPRSTSFRGCWRDASASGSASTRTRSSAACRSCSAACASTTRAGSRATPTATCSRTR